MYIFFLSFYFFLVFFVNVLHVMLFQVEHKIILGEQLYQLQLYIFQKNHFCDNMMQLAFFFFFNFNSISKLFYKFFVVCKVV